MQLLLSEVTDLLVRKGHYQYGTEAVSQLEHALQCAYGAENSGETPHTIVACLLHDIGHLFAADNALTVPEKGNLQDDRHQCIALPFLKPLFPLAVLEPIRMHVDAKRYLCFAEPGYWNRLSSASKRSLQLQGGIFRDSDARIFIAQPFAQEAVKLRRYDDLAKVKGKVVPDINHYLPLIEQVCIHQTPSSQLVE
jgi:phosphonate degradation associated HDIG domain protein